MSSNKLKKALLNAHRSPSDADSPMNDQVGGNWYTKLKIQPLEYAMDNEFNPCQAKVVKYVSRYNLKHKNIKDQVKDLEKAKHVLDILIKKIQEK